MASDVVVGQTLRYLGYVKHNVAINNEDVRGLYYRKWCWSRFKTRSFGNR